MSLQLPLWRFSLSCPRTLTVKTDAILTHLTDLEIVHRGGAFVAITRQVESETNSLTWVFKKRGCRFRVGTEPTDILRRKDFESSAKTEVWHQQQASLTEPYSAPCHSAHSAGASPLHPEPAPYHLASLLAIYGDLVGRSLTLAWIARASSAAS